MSFGASTIWQQSWNGIKLDGAPPVSIRPLDHYGVPKKETVPVEKDGTFKIDGRYRAYYYEVRR